MDPHVFGIMAPHPPIMVEEVGGRRAEVTRLSSDAMNEAAAMLAEWDPDTVVIMSPHAPAVSDAFVVETAAFVEGDLGQFGAPQVRLGYQGDSELGEALVGGLGERGVPAVDRARTASLRSGWLDHGVVVPMSFLDRAGRWPLLVISLSWLPYHDHLILGEELIRAAELLGRRIAFVASGDCSHRLTKDAPAGYDPIAEEFDAKLVSLIGASDFTGLTDLDPAFVERAGECGLRSFITMGAVAAPATSRVLAYEGPWGVGYLTAVVNEQLLGGTGAGPEPPSGATPDRGLKHGAAGSPESEIVALARHTIDSYLTTGRVPGTPSLADPALPGRAGAFVSLHRAGMLRGCIGTIAPTEPSLADEVVRNAVQAATEDPRFPPMTSDELADLEISVDVLHTAEDCEFEDLDPSEYGCIVSSGWKRGLLLPDLEGVDSPEQQVEISCRKAGIAPGERLALQRFKVDRYV